MEITLEKIELVKDRTGVTYKEAKEALEAADGNVVDAIISIEDTIDEQTQAKKLGKQSEALIDKMKEIVKRGNVSRIIIRKNGKDILNVPLNAGVLGAVIAPWGMVAAALAALGTKCEIELVKTDGSSIDLSGKAEDLGQVAKEKGTKIYDELKEKAPGFYESAKEAGGAVISKVKDKAGYTEISEEDFDNEWYGGGIAETPDRGSEEPADTAAAVEEAAAAADAADSAEAPETQAEEAPEAPAEDAPETPDEQ